MPDDFFQRRTLASQRQAANWVVGAVSRCLIVWSRITFAAAPDIFICSLLMYKDF